MPITEIVIKKSVVGEFSEHLFSRFADTNNVVRSESKNKVCFKYLKGNPDKIIEEWLEVFTENSYFWLDVEIKIDGKKINPFKNDLEEVKELDVVDSKIMETTMHKIQIKLSQIPSMEIQQFLSSLHPSVKEKRNDAANKIRYKYCGVSEEAGEVIFKQLDKLSETSIIPNLAKVKLDGSRIKFKKRKKKDECLYLKWGTKENPSQFSKRLKINPEIIMDVFSNEEKSAFKSIGKMTLTHAMRDVLTEKVHGLKISKENMTNYFIQKY